MNMKTINFTNKDLTRLIMILFIILISFIASLWADEIKINLTSDKTNYKLNDDIKFNVEVKNVSKKSFYFFVPTVYKASYLLIKDKEGNILQNKRIILLKKYPFSKEDFKFLNPGDKISFKINGKLLLEEKPIVLKKHPEFNKKMVLNFTDCIFEPKGPGEYFICFQLTKEDYPVNYFAKELGIENFWSGAAKSNELDLGLQLE